MTLDVSTSPPRRTTALVDRIAAVLDDRSSRRGFLSRVAVVGSAMAVGPVRYALRPGTAYANVCGTDSSCGSGYTVFCATVNGGVNRCPPNSLVGGWWKADNSGFCCGSARYYIDCHSYCSCGCGGGSSFCGEGCRSCSCGCGPGDSCDQRRVCCNNFRYGQCMQHVTCTGPVWCRVVTCTPPWRVPAWCCSTAPATDNRTGAHTAPGLPNCTAVDQRYTALGGPGSFLGETRTAELGTPDGRGRFTHYDGGSIYWTSQTGAHAVGGEIRRTWERLGWERSPLGYPTTSETGTPDGVGRFNHFQGSGGVGSIYWTPGTGAHGVWGDIRRTWAGLGYETSPLGYPTTSERRTPDGRGRYNHFRGRGGVGSIYWSPATGANALWGEIRRVWERQGFERGTLGYPATSERAAAGGGGRYNDFVGRGTASAPAASVYWSRSTGAVSVRGRTRTAWLGEGGTAGDLGFPVAEPYADPSGGTRSDFQGGYVVEDSSGSVTVVRTGR